jgi:PPE-repeat protein
MSFKEKSMRLTKIQTATFETGSAAGHAVNSATVPPQVRAMDFGALPPEINSGRLYSGPGAEPMLTAAAGWEGLAAGLREVAMSYQSATLKLADAWQGPAAVAMTKAVAPHVGWLNSVAAQAERTAAQAKAAASAYEAALAATVPPPLIAASQAVRKAMATTNHLGQLSPLIADADAGYERMWAQDADAMYAYAGTSAAAATVTPFPPPPAAADLAGQAGPGIAAQEILSTGYQLISILPQALRALSSSPFTPFEGTLSSVLSSLLKMSSLIVPANFSMSPADFVNTKMGFGKATISTGARALGAGIAPLGGTGAATAAGIGRGTSMGVLSVPQAWRSAATPSPVPAKLQRRGWVCEPIVEVADGEPPFRD